MEGEHAQMWQIPCKMTNSSSKPLQTLGKWYQPRNPKKIPKPAEKKNPKTISHPFRSAVMFLLLLGFLDFEDFQEAQFEETMEDVGTERHWGGV